ncbi:MAG TPA: UvrD-helicase domain-containing protein [Ignavibacteria bacterium]|nr:UvrD-helicase domain-containing protein [Ignavibacteria bacterium]
MALKSKENTQENPQDELINSTEGIYLVDAGAGTGKTYSIVKRYEKIIDKETNPEDILLITFTNNAAEQMKEEVIIKLKDRIGISKLLEAPIMTFHSFCSKLLKTYGTSSPSYLGLDEYLPGNFNVLEEDSFEKELFRKYFLEFSKLNASKYREILYAFEGQEENILKIIKKLCSIGIFPTSKGWKEDDREKLEGNIKEYSERFDRLNEAVPGKKKDEVQNLLYKKFKTAMTDKLYADFKKDNIFSETTIKPEAKDEIFNDDRQEEYIEFMKDIYFSYIQYLLKRNLINFEFMIMFAYLILMNDKNARKKMQYEYVMIDEFQDTDELQFKIIMLLCKNVNGNANLCVVGDWKQGIYGFRNAQIENITEYGNNLKLYKKELNGDELRIEYETGEFKKIIFEINYRSSESILKFSKLTLLTKGSGEDEVDEEKVNENFKEILKPGREIDDLTEIKFYQAENRLDEYQLVLKKISELVNEKGKYKIRVFDKKSGEVIEERNIKYSDICVLSRKTKFCLELQREALRAGIPLNFRGGLEIFASEQGVLVLGWLRLMVNEDDISGWIPVLDKEGYSYTEIKNIKKNISEKNENSNKLFPDLPEDLNEFLNHLRKLRNNILFAVEAILSRYKYHDVTGNKIISVIQGWMNTELFSLNDLIQIIDRSAQTRVEIDFGVSTDAVLTQTIHKSKGLEYPVVILANVNVSNFPDTKGEQGNFIYNTMSGLRAKTFFGTNGKYFYKYNNWRTDLVNAVARNTDKDEERRLLYVAVTRAKQYLYITSYNPSYFFSELAKTSDKEIIQHFNYEIVKAETEKLLTNIEISIDTALEKSKEFISPHSLMEEINADNLITEIDKKENSVNLEKKSLEFGLMIHRIANRLANGISVDSELPETGKIKKYLAGLNAYELKAEVDFLYPDNENGSNSIIRGTIDLLAFKEDEIIVIDYKTDSSKNNLEKYKLQLSIYIKVVKSIYKDMKVRGEIYFVCLDEVVAVNS